MRKIVTKLATPAVPVISGTAQVGKTLTARGGNRSFQWQREGSAIPGATYSSYTLQAADLGALISVESNGNISKLAGPVIGTTVRYVSNSLGNDTWDGTAPAFVSGTTGPWKTLAKVNAQTFAPGTSVLFKRGDKWDRSAGPSVDGQLRPSNSSSGTPGNPIVYDAYGIGANPILDGSADASQTSDWQLVSGSTTVWQSVQTFYPKTAKTVTITLANPAVVTWNVNRPINGHSIVFATTGALPANITAGQIYYVINTSGSTFQISATHNGSAISTAGQTQSGTHTAGANGLPYIDANDIGNVIWGFSPLGGTTPSAAMTATAGVEKGGLSVDGGVNFVYYKPGDGPNNIGTTNGNWNFNTDNFRVQIVSNSGVNPATAFPGIRLAMDAAPISIQNGDYSIFQNFTLQNTANACVYLFAGTTLNGITVRDNVMQWIGGGNNGGQNQTGRIGDGINTAGGLDDILFERNFIYQAYDGGISPQTSPANRNNMTIRNNIINKYGTAIGILNTVSSGSWTQNGLYIYNNTCYESTSWSMTPVLQRPNGDSQRQSMNLMYGAGITVSNQDIRNNVFAGSSAFWNNCAFGMSSYTCPIPVLTSTLVGATWLNFDYNNWSAANGSPTQYVGFGIPSLSTWFSNRGFEVHGLKDVNPSLTNTTNDFTPAVSSPLRNVGANLYSVAGSAPNGVVWDFNKKPRPASGMFTIGAIQ